MQLNRKDDGFKIKGWKRVMQQKISTPNMVMTQPHRFALQEGKYVERVLEIKVPRFHWGRTNFSPKHIFMAEFLAQESVPNGKFDQPVHTHTPAMLRLLRKIRFFSFATRSTGKENKGFF